MMASTPTARRRWIMATSLPRPSPSGFTCVVRQMRMPGRHSAATSRAAALGVMVPEFVIAES